MTAMMNPRRAISRLHATRRARPLAGRGLSSTRQSLWTVSAPQVLAH